MFFRNARRKSTLKRKLDSSTGSEKKNKQRFPKKLTIQHQLKEIWIY